MTKTEIRKSMKEHTNGAEFITKKALAEYMGMKDVHSVDRFVAGLEKVGKSYYFIPDVAEVIIREASR